MTQQGAKTHMKCITKSTKILITTILNIVKQTLFKTGKESETEKETIEIINEIKSVKFLCHGIFNDFNITQGQNSLPNSMLFRHNFLVKHV